MQIRGGLNKNNIMKTSSNEYPTKIQPLGNGKYLINFDIEEVEIEERESYNYISLYVDDISRVNLIKVLVAYKYGIEDEIKILYRGTPEQVQEHEDWVAWCKEYVSIALTEFEEV